MIDLRNFIEQFRNENIDFYTGVPDSLLNDFCLHLQSSFEIKNHVLAANEGNAIGIACGNYLLTGKVPVVYMQNSGIGNALNPLISLTSKDVYSIPLVLLIGWRGDPSIKDHLHHSLQGQLTPVLMENINIPYKILENDESKVSSIISWAKNTAIENSSPVAIIVKKGVLSKKVKIEKKYVDESVDFTREEAMKRVIDLLPKNTIYVATTGRAARELYHIRKNQGIKQEFDILNVGAMGHASSIALGIAISDPKRLVVCFDGDASAIMHMGSMTINASVQECNLLHIVLNNGVHESVGGQKSVGQMIDFTNSAKSFGYKVCNNEIKSNDGLTKQISLFKSVSGPKFMDLWIKPGIREDLPPFEANLMQVKTNFMKKNVMEESNEGN
ncbi:hypothetical protein KQ51_00728 [Candidatus Izimaplasma bacterium HR1]|jgi:phosphonopyruvate decarboxylase|uniref:phosphonopyruvate decarboxylase n=1 Tax=Candidatus Izimoplasma sp. HR1 TaxID=1541959 RepID=UPI0004F71FF0|nr:hypothetical protein KQ51_00728 [Candidatus Izimaplasma bacterium HR1]